MCVCVQHIEARSTSFAHMYMYIYIYDIIYMTCMYVCV